MSTSTTTTHKKGPASALRDWVGRGGLRERRVLLLGLIILLLIVMKVLSAAGITSGNFNSDYLAASLINYVPMALLALAELFVILSGRGSIDLSVGSVVSVVGMAFGILYAEVGLPLVVSIIAAVILGGLLGAFNGLLTAYFGYPALITTLATYYAYRAIALLVTGASPISGTRTQEFYAAADSIELPLFGQYFPLVPLGVFTFLLPVAVIAWFLLNRTTYGRSLYGIGTNTTAAHWSGINTRRTQMLAFVGSGAVAGLVGVYTVAEFASARPDAGSSGAGMALPAITIAVLGGVAITGGIGRLSGILFAALLITWLDASILLVVPGNAGAQLQYLALGVVLLAASLVSGLPAGAFLRWRRRRPQEDQADATQTAPPPTE